MLTDQRAFHRARLHQQQPAGQRLGSDVFQREALFGLVGTDILAHVDRLVKPHPQFVHLAAEVPATDNRPGHRHLAASRVREKHRAARAGVDERTVQDAYALAREISRHIVERGVRAAGVLDLHAD